MKVRVQVVPVAWVAACNALRAACGPPGLSTQVHAPDTRSYRTGTGPGTVLVFTSTLYVLSFFTLSRVADQSVLVEDPIEVIKSVKDPPTRVARHGPTPRRSESDREDFYSV